MFALTSWLACCAAALALYGCTSIQTKPILDDQGRVQSGSVASLEPVELGGVRQWILVRGRDVRKPLLLKLHGGPGQAEMATVHLNYLLEQDFVVVEWDQRGAGKSAAGISPASAMTIDQFVEDTLELTRLLLQRFGRERLILVGHSWGSIVGLKAVQKSPGLYAAFVSTGQIASDAQGQAVAYRFAVGEARRRGEQAAVRELERLGPPPYVAIGDRMALVRRLETFGALWHSPRKFDRVGWMLSSVEYSWPEKLGFPFAASRSFELLLPQLAAVDMQTDVPAVAVPVFFAVGRHDRLAPVEVSQAYFSRLAAPAKEWLWFDHSAHFPQWEEPERFHELLIRKVLPMAGP
jgi:pimeloyl-ACP methyl ester carboxylesterase